MFDQDEAAMSEREGAEETEREQEKLGLRGGRTAWPLRRGRRGCWRGRRGGTSGTGKGCGGCGCRSALVRSVCTVMLVGDLDVDPNLGCDHVDHETQTH